MRIREVLTAAQGPLAESLCGTALRLDLPRVSGPWPRSSRAAPLPHADPVLRLLSPHTNASRARQGRVPREAHRRAGGIALATGQGFGEGQQYLGQYSLPEPVSRCPTVAADLGRARSAQRPHLGRCPRNFGAPGSRSRPRSPAEPAGARNANHTGSNPRGIAPTVAELPFQLDGVARAA